MAIWVALGTGTKWAPQILGSSWFLPCNLTPNAHHILTPLQMKPHALSSNLLPPSLSPSLPAACSYIVFSLTTSIAKWLKCQQAGQSPIPELPPDILLLPRLLQPGLGMAVRCHRDPSWFSSIPELQGVRQWLTSRVPYPELWGGGVVAPGSAGVPCHLCRCLTQTEQALWHAGTCGLFPHPQQHLSDSSRVLTLPSEAALLLSSWIYRSLTTSDAVGTTCIYIHPGMFNYQRHQAHRLQLHVHSYLLSIYATHLFNWLHFLLCFFSSSWLLPIVQEEVTSIIQNRASKLAPVYNEGVV